MWISWNIQKGMLHLFCWKIIIMMETINCELNATFFYYWFFFKNQQWFFYGIFQFSITKSEKKTIICVFGFHFVAINIKGWLNICIPYLGYSQIWLYLLGYGHHFFKSSYLWWSLELHKKILEETLIVITWNAKYKDAFIIFNDFSIYILKLLPK
jgi:hypothetical protein